MKNIASALVKAQREFGPVVRSAKAKIYNPKNPDKGFEYGYADLESCVEAVMKALNNNGIFLLQKTHDSETGVKIETVFIHESGDQVSSGILHVPAPKSDPQGYGSAITYARRYSLMAACGIAPEDDDGNAASSYNEYENKHLPIFREKALQGFASLEEAQKALPASPHKAQFWRLWGDIFKPAAEKNNASTKADRLADTLVA